MGGEPAQRGQVRRLAGVGEPQVDARVELVAERADRAPQRRAPRRRHVEGGPPGDHGHPAWLRAVLFLGSFPGHGQRAEELQEPRDETFPDQVAVGGVVGEVVDRAQPAQLLLRGRRPQPIGLQGLHGDPRGVRRHPPGPHIGELAVAGDHPARTGRLRRPVAEMLGGGGPQRRLAVRVQQRPVGAAVGGEPGPRVARPRAGVGVPDQDQAAGHEQPPDDDPRRRRERRGPGVGDDQVTGRLPEQAGAEVDRRRVRQIRDGEPRRTGAGPGALPERLEEPPGARLRGGEEPELRLTGQLLAAADRGLLGRGVLRELGDARHAPRAVPQRPDQLAGVEGPRGGRGRPDDELRLPADHVRGAGQHILPRVGERPDVRAEVRDALAGGGVVQRQRPADLLAERQRELAALVQPRRVRRHVVARQAAGGGQPVDGEIRHPPRHCGHVGALHRVVEQRLQSAVEQRGLEQVPGPLAVAPQPRADADVEQQLLGARVFERAVDHLEVRPVLEVLADDGRHLLVERLAAAEPAGREPGPVQGADAGGWRRRRQPPDLAGTVQHARDFVVALVGRRRNTERERVRLARLGLQLGLQPDRRAGQHARLAELHLGEVRGRAAERLQHHLDVAGGRHDRGVLHPVVGEPREVRGAHPHLEPRPVAGDPAAEQRARRVLAAPQEERVVGERVHHPPFVLRVRRQQVADRLDPRVPGREVERHPGPVQRAQRLAERQPAVGAAAQRRHARDVRAALAEALADRGQQRGVRGDLDDQVRAELPDGRLDRGREPDRAPDVRPPVGGVQVLGHLAGHAGDERHAGRHRQRVEEGERIAQARLDDVHRAGVERDVAAQQPVADAALLEQAHREPDVRRAAAGHRARRGVLAGDLQARRDVGELAQDRLGTGQVEADGEHPAGPGGALLLLGPVPDQPGRLCQRVDAGRVRGRDLAGAVPDDAAGPHPPRPQQLRERDLDHEDHRLREPAFVQPLLRSPEALRAQREPGQLPPRRVHGVDGLPEHRLGRVQLPAAPGPLRPLPGEHHEHPRLAGPFSNGRHRRHSHGRLISGCVAHRSGYNRLRGTHIRFARERTELCAEV